MKKKYYQPKIDVVELCLATGICSPVGGGGNNENQSGEGTGKNDW